MPSVGLEQVLVMHIKTVKGLTLVVNQQTLCIGNDNLWLIKHYLNQVLEQVGLCHVITFSDPQEFPSGQFSAFVPLLEGASAVDFIGNEPEPFILSCP